MKKAIITVGLGFGDEAKGACVDYLCRTLNADLVVRYSGGSQCGHNVELPDGRRHTFSQFGSGTLAGVPTYLGPQVIVNPAALKAEAEHLQQEMGVKKPYSMLTMHPNCLISTVFHQRLNQIKELYRGADRHGSCGHGIGETRNYWLRYGKDAISVMDLCDTSVGVLADKLELLKQRILIEIAETVGKQGRGIEQQHKSTLQGVMDIRVSNLAKWYLDMWQSASFDGLDVHDDFGRAQMVIFEGAQGILLDEWYGFHPHTTWSTVTPHFAVELAEQAGCEEVSILGITRTYTTRHGNGPFPTMETSLSMKFRDPGNPQNEWQGNLEYGWLDFPLLRYAANICKTWGGLDGIILNHMDQISHEYKVCTDYKSFQCGEEGYPSLFWPKPHILDLKNQEDMGKRIMVDHPVYKQVNAGQLLEMLWELAPVVGTATGPTHKDRSIETIPFRPW
jgi:adenylosuccinate synthase